MAFGSAIKKLREDAGISVDKLTGLIGVKAARWRKWEEKDFDPRDEDQAAIETFFHLDLEEIGKLKSIKEFVKVKNTSNKDDDALSDMTPGQVIASLLQANKDYAEGFKALAKVMERIEEGMAQEKTQAIISDKVDDLTSNLENLWNGLFVASTRQAVDRESVLEALSKLSGKPADHFLKVANKKAAGIFEASGVPDKMPAKRK